MAAFSGRIPSPCLNWGMTNPAFELCDTAAAVAAFGTSAAEIDALDDEAVLVGLKAFSAHRANSDAYGAWFAATVARRSTKELGNAGLARQQGFPTPEALIQDSSGSSWQDAAKLVKTGTMMAEADTAAAVDAARQAREAALEAARLLAREMNTEPEPVPVDPILLLPVSPEAEWRAPLVAAVAAKTISQDQSMAIRDGLGVVSTAVSAQMLRGAVLILLSGRDTTAQLFKRARQMRDSMDSEGVQRGQVDRRSLQYVKAHRKANGMVAGSYAFADADAALWWETYTHATAPRSGGPRSTDPDQAARDTLIVDDDRNPGQVAADYFINLLQVGIDADPATILGNKHPAVRIIVEETVLTTRQADASATGIGRIEGMTDAVTLAAVEQALCNTGFLGIKFDDSGKCLDLGHTQRLFTQRQRIALAVRDGGCRAPGCDKPPSWCEAHHIDFWDRDEGKTNVDDGMLLCRFHHSLFHSTGWEIERSGGHYFLIPPRTLDPLQHPILMPSKALAIRAITEPALHALLARTSPLQIDPPTGPFNDSNAQPKAQPNSTPPPSATPTSPTPTPLGETVIPMTPDPGKSDGDSVRFVWSDTLWDDEENPDLDTPI
ncbi:MAG: hypothetical protein JWQ43_468 [Glaciihabitans sp.]|nr:hypothetical protein [Glaciihabitans sp.]